MTKFQGFPINEKWLQVQTVTSGIMAILLIVALGVCVYLCLPKTIVDSPTKREKVKKYLDSLKKRAETDPAAKRQLDRRLRKQKKQQNKHWYSSIPEIVFSIFVGVVLFVCVVFLFVPSYEDYHRKDYAIYTGTFKVMNVMHESDTVVLSDGTKLLERGFHCADGFHTGTIVYGRRSGVVVGIIEETD